MFAFDVTINVSRHAPAHVKRKGLNMLTKLLQNIMQRENSERLECRYHFTTF